MSRNNPVPSKFLRTTGQTMFLSVLLLTGIFFCLTASGQESSSTGKEDQSTSLREKDRSELQDLLRSRVEQLNDLQDRTFDAKQTSNRRIRDAKSKLSTLQEELRDLKQTRTSKKETLRTLRQKIDRLESEKASLKTSLSNLSSRSDQLQRSLETHIRRTVPYERSDRQNAISSPGESTDSNEINRLQTLIRAARAELSDSSSAELLNRRVPLSSSDDARKKHAHLVRIGQNTLFYVTEDGTHAGSFVWSDGNWRPREASNERKKRFREAIRIQQGQSPPARLPLPVIIPPATP